MKKCRMGYCVTVQQDKKRLKKYAIMKTSMWATEFKKAGKHLVYLR